MPATATPTTLESPGGGGARGYEAAPKLITVCVDLVAVENALAYRAGMAQASSRDTDLIASALAASGLARKRPVALVDRGGRCAAGEAHAPVWGRADMAELSDHPRGTRYAAGPAYGVTVWVTRCGACEVPLLLIGHWGTGRTDPPTTIPSLVFELDGAELPPEAQAALDRQAVDRAKS